MKAKKELTDREKRRLSKWKFAKELECIDMFLHNKCVKASQGRQIVNAKGSGSNGKIYEVSVEIGQYFTTYGKLIEQLPLNEPIDENRLKTLLNALSGDKCTKFNVQDVLTYSKGCTKINVQGIPNLGIMISLVDITDKALFEQLEKDSNYVRNLIFVRTKINVQEVQNSICKNTNIISTNDKSTKIEKENNNSNNSTFVESGYDWKERDKKLNEEMMLRNKIFTTILHKEYNSFFYTESSFKTSKEQSKFNSLTHDDVKFINNIYWNYKLDKTMINPLSFTYTDVLDLLEMYKEIDKEDILKYGIARYLRSIVGMFNDNKLEYIKNLKGWISSKISRDFAKEIVQAHKQQTN